MRKAIYAFSGDPITNGHIDIVQRARRVFDHVIVAIGINPKKKYTFSLAERKKMAEKCFSLDPAIEVVSFSNLLIDFAYEQGAHVIIRGVRNTTDFNDESILDAVGKSMEMGIDTHILFTDPDLACVSSSAVKEIAKYNGNMIKHVPLHVKQALEERQNEQYIIGITGEIGCGKSHIGKILTSMQIPIIDYVNMPLHYDFLDVHSIELDHIGHEILGELTEPAYIDVRRHIWVAMDDDHVLDDEGFINREVLGSIVFNDRDKLAKLNRILKKPIEVRLRQKLAGMKGLILINCALLVEANLLHICNNNVVLIDVNKEVQKQRLIERGLTEDKIKTRLKCQYTKRCKRIAIEETIEYCNHGKLWTIDNSNNLDKDDIKFHFKKIAQELLYGDK